MALGSVPLVSGILILSSFCVQEEIHGSGSTYSHFCLRSIQEGSCRGLLTFMDGHHTRSGVTRLGYGQIIDRNDVPETLKDGYFRPCILSCFAVCFVALAYLVQNAGLDGPRNLPKGRILERLSKLALHVYGFLTGHVPIYRQVLLLTRPLLLHITVYHYLTLPLLRLVALFRSFLFFTQRCLLRHVIPSICYIFYFIINVLPAVPYYVTRLLAQILRQLWAFIFDMLRNVTLIAHRCFANVGFYVWMFILRLFSRRLPCGCLPYNIRKPVVVVDQNARWEYSFSPHPCYCDPRCLKRSSQVVFDSASFEVVC